MASAILAQHHRRIFVLSEGLTLALAQFMSALGGVDREVAGVDFRDRESRKVVAVKRISAPGLDAILHLQKLFAAQGRDRVVNYLFPTDGGWGLSSGKRRKQQEYERWSEHGDLQPHFTGAFSAGTGGILKSIFSTLPISLSGLPKSF